MAKKAARKQTRAPVAQAPTAPEVRVAEEKRRTNEEGRDETILTSTFFFLLPRAVYRKKTTHAAFFSFSNDLWTL